MELDLPLIGFERELSRLQKAFERRESLLLLGARGSGKTTLLRAALRESGTGAIYVRSSAVLHDLLVNLARSLRLADPTPGSGTSMHLKGILWTAMEENPVTIVLDDIQGSGPRNYRFLQRLFHMKGVGIIAAARDYNSLGALSRLFWDPRLVVNVPALTQPQSTELFNELAPQFGLTHLDIDEFRRHALEAAKGNPGEIVEMCKLAGRPQYQHGSRVKFAPLRIDALMNLGALDKAQGRGNRFRANRYPPVRTGAER